MRSCRGAVLCGCECQETMGDNVPRNGCFSEEAKGPACKNALLPTWPLGSQRCGGLEEDQSQLEGRFKKCRQPWMRASGRGTDEKAEEQKVVDKEAEGFACLFPKLSTLPAEQWKKTLPSPTSFIQIKRSTEIQSEQKNKKQKPDP